MSDFSNLVFNKSDSKETNLEIIQHLVSLGYSELLTSSDYLNELEYTTHIVGSDYGHVVTTVNPSCYGNTIYDFEQYLKEREVANQTPKTPYQEKGYTDNSLFKFVGEEGQFDKGEIIKLHYDDGDDCPDFKSITRDRSRYCCLFEVEYIGEEGAEGMIPDYEEATVKGITSDGGASDYYFTKLPQHIIDSIVITGGIEIKDIARYVYDNDADAFNIIKAEKRIIEERKGTGKLGTTALYDANKIKFFANEQYEAIKHMEVNKHG